jgi:alkaline phosphatase
MAQKAGYVDGFVFVVPKKNQSDYRKMAILGKKIWMKHGALDYKECIGDDLKVKSMGGMKPLSFTKLARSKTGEAVWFSFISYKSKSHRDSVNAKVMKDPLMSDPTWKDKPMPFDMRKMAYGGFKVVITK